MQTLLVLEHLDLYNTTLVFGQIWMKGGQKDVYPVIGDAFQISVFFKGRGEAAGSQQSSK